MPPKKILRYTVRVTLDAVKFTFGITILSSYKWHRGGGRVKSTIYNPQHAPTNRAILHLIYVYLYYILLLCNKTIKQTASDNNI